MEQVTRFLDFARNDMGRKNLVLFRFTLQWENKYFSGFNVPFHEPVRAFKATVVPEINFREGSEYI